MTLLLCLECCQWREPVEGRCPVCAGTLDIAVPDPTVETLADEIGDGQGLLGDADVSRRELPKRGRLWATTNGLLFVPNESRVIVFEDERRATFSNSRSPGSGDLIDSKQMPNQSTHRGAVGGQRPNWLREFVNRVWTRLVRHVPVARFASERRANVFAEHDRQTLAELLRSDPGVLFWSRGAISTWRRQRGQWEFLRPNASSWPERIAMRDRDGDRALQTWLETTECPLPVNLR